MTKKGKYINSLIAFFYILSFVNCSMSDDNDYFLSEPICFDFAIDNDMSTRTTYLSTDKTVFVTADAGINWFAYQYNSTNGVWEAVKLYSYDSSNSSQPWTTTTLTSGGITWTSQSMLIYAVVRNDNEPSVDNVSPLATAITIPSNQSTGNEGADFWGTVTQISYTSGRAALTLQHLVSRLRVSITNCNSEPTSCTSSAKPTKGTIAIGGDKISIGSQGTNAAFSLFRESYDATAKTATYLAYFLPGSLAVDFSFTLTNGDGTYKFQVATKGGITLDSGATTLMNVKLP